MPIASLRAPGRDDTRFAMEPRTFAGFLVAIAAVVVIAVLSYDSLRETHVRSESLARTVEVLAQIQGLVSTLKDAETGQRGYLLTGRESYLEPFLNAKRVLPDQFANLRALLGDDPAQRTHLDTLQALANDKLNELMRDRAVAPRGPDRGGHGARPHRPGQELHGPDPRHRRRDARSSASWSRSGRRMAQSRHDPLSGSPPVGSLVLLCADRRRRGDGLSRFQGAATRILAARRPDRA